MKTPDNIQYFNLVTGFIFSRLYLNFPIPIKLECTDIMYFIDLPSHFNQSDFFYYSIKWLTTNRYITHNTKEIQVQFFRDVLLTDKGFAVLNSVPDVLTNGSKNLGDQITDSVKKVALESVSYNVKIALSKSIFMHFPY